MELFNKFVWSIIEPDNTNDIWFNGKTFNIYKEGKWKPFTINVEQAEEFFKNVENTFKLYQKKLTPGRGITLEDDVISTTQLFQVVKTLPDKGEYNTIYLVLKNIPEDGDYFYEFIWIDNKWEKLGEFKQNINLENYYTKEDIDSKNYISHTEVDEKLETKVSVEEGKGLSTNDYTDEDKEKLTTIKSKVLNIGNTTQEEVDNWKWLFDQPDCHEYCGRINLAGYNVGFYHNFKKSQNTDAYQIYVTTTDGYLYTGVLTKASIVLNQRIYFTQHYYQPTLKSGVNIATINKHSLLTSENISIYSDWDSDSNSSNYIHNKPFYANWSLEKDLSAFVYDNTWQLIDSFSNAGSTTYIKYTWGNTTKYVAIPYRDSNEYALNYGPPIWVKRDHDGGGIFLRSPSKHDFTIKIATSINKLSDIFLPDTAALKSDLTTKQDTIEDLSTIRENASKGATALQSVPSEYINETELQQSLSTKADINGDYPDMSVGLAEDLGGRPFTNDAEFSFRATADKENSIKDGLANIKTLKGNSVVWNQQNQDPYFQRANEWTSSKITLSISDGVLYGEVTNADSAAFYALHIINIPNHYYAYIIDYKASEGTCYIYAGGKGYSLGKNSGNRETRSIVFEGGATFVQLSMYPNLSAPVGSTFEVYGIRFYDLTQMFGAGNEPTTIEEFYARIPSGVDMNACNAGEVIHMTAEGIKSVGDNAYNDNRDTFVVPTYVGAGIFEFANTKDVFVGVTRDGYIRQNGVTQYTKLDNGYSFSVAQKANGYGLGVFEQALPNAEYYLSWLSEKGRVVAGFYNEKGHVISHTNLPRFTTPNNCKYILLVITSIDGIFDQEIIVSDIMLTLVHSGWKQDTNAGYQPYWEDNLMFDQRIKDEFPDRMKKWDKVYNKDGKGYIVKGTGVVDMGELVWTIGYGDMFANQNAFYVTIYNASNSLNEFISPKYSITAIGSNSSGMYKFTDKTFVAADSTYTDAASFKAAMAGVPLYYELAEPTIIEYDEPFNLDYKVADFGTEQAIGNSPSAPISAEIEYDFGANDTIRTNKLAINELREKIKEVAIEDIDTIREGAAKGMTAIQEHQDISHLATKEELAEINTAISNRVELKYYVRDVSPVTLSSAALNSCYIYTGAAGDVRINNLANPTSSEARYEFRFSGATSLTIPSKVIWANGEEPEIDSTAYYELSIVATQTADGYVYKAVLGKFM